MILVTGGSSGIGAAIAADLRSHGESVQTISRNPRDSDEHHSCNVGDFQSLKTVYQKVLGIKKPVKALINCAGIASMNLALTTPPEVTERVIQTNLIGTIYSCQIFAPLLIRNGGGRIINFSTIAVPLGLKGESVYVASKAGIEGFSRCLAKELAEFKITVNCVAPGPIKTGLLKGITDKQISQIVARQTIQRLMGMNDVVQLTRLLLSEESSNLTGEVFHLGGV